MNGFLGRGGFEKFGESGLDRGRLVVRVQGALYYLRLVAVGIEVAPESLCADACAAFCTSHRPSGPTIDPVAASADRAPTGRTAHNIEATPYDRVEHPRQIFDSLVTA